ncbi:MAG: tRNA-dihydrouridine synthase, partial [Firmicutes bacterium]|nr:tRNA-dihydrouridine synthase [Bacillota bacterium]
MFKFCGIELSSPFFLAPLAGITDKTFRFLCREQGAALSYTEMVSAKGLFYQSDASAELMETEEREGPVGVQLFGSDPSM